jgi:hypothetical protein
MVTINNLINSGANFSGIGNGSREKMDELKNQYRNKEIDSEEYRKGMMGLKEEQKDERIVAAAMGAETANNVSSLFAYMNSSTNNGTAAVWGSGVFSQEFFSGKSELSSMQAMNSARIGIENRARSLTGEIGRDRARGYDVTEKQEALANLVGNREILNRNLSASIEGALSDGRKDRPFIDIVGRIRESLKTEETPTSEKLGESEKPESALAADGDVAGKMAEVAKEKAEDEKTIADQIAEGAKAQYAESSNILDIPKDATELGITPANA